MELYGSLTNRLDEMVTGRPEPEVGIGLTESMWSDRHAYRVVEVISRRKDGKPKMIRAVGCWVRCKDYFGGDWEVSMSEDKPADDERYGIWHCHGEVILKRTRKGNWTTSGTEQNTKYLPTECPREYEDPSF